MKTVAVIGLGTLGTTIYERLSTHYELRGLDKSADLAQARQAELIIIAVKPQSFAELAQDLQKHVTGQTIISVMAGITIERIAEGLRTTKVVRTMPTLALAAGQSLTAAFGKADAATEDLLRVWGEVMWLEREDQFDSFTALAGSGPAYILEMVAQLQAQAGKLGFDPQASQVIANKTLTTATAILGNDSAVDRIKAKSTGQGVTEAALAVLAQNHFDTLIADVVVAAKKRSEELSK